MLLILLRFHFLDPYSWNCFYKSALSSASTAALLICLSCPRKIFFQCKMKFRWQAFMTSAPLPHKLLLPPGILSFYFSSLNLHHLLEVLMDGLLQVLCWPGCSGMLSSTDVLLGDALHMCLPGFKLNLTSSCYCSRKAMKTRYIKTMAKNNSKFPLLLTK